MIRRLGTSPAQLYRLLDQTNSRKSIDQMLALLRVLDCDVELVVRDKGCLAGTFQLDNYLHTQNRIVASTNGVT